jgi:hypothetical protein
MKGCVGLLILMVVLAAGGYVFLLFTPMHGSIGLPITAAVLAVLALGNVWAIVLSLRKLRAVRPPSQWSDGGLVGFSGQITAGPEALAAPGSGRACSIYEYSLRHESQQPEGTSNTSRNTAEVAAYDGMAMAPCVVQSGGSGFRLVGFPLLAHVPKQRYSTPEELRRMAEHLLTSHIVEKPKGVREAYRTLRDLLADEDGVVRHDQAAAYAFDLAPFLERHATDPDFALAGLAEQLERNDYYIEETIVPEGAQVTVFGKYRAGDRTIDVGSGLQNIERGLHLGPAAKVPARDLRRSLVMLLVFLVPAAGLYYWFGRALWPAFRPAPYSEQSLRFDDALSAMFRPSHAASVLVQLAQQEDAEAIGVLLRLGAKPNAATSSEIAPLRQAGKPETVRALLEGGADPNTSDHTGTTPLHRFTERGDLDTVRLLLAHGAQVDATDGYGNTALHRAGVYGHLAIADALLTAGAHPNARARDGSTPLDEARANGHDEVADLLLQRGSAETEVTAENGTPIGLRDLPLQVVDAYLAALHARDGATLTVLDASASAVDWSTVDWDALLPGWPTAARQAMGFANDQHATVRVRGVARDGVTPTLPIGFALQRNPTPALEDPLAAYGGWRITRSWIEWGDAR